MDGSEIQTGAIDAFVCVISGTVGGLIIGLVTEYYTSFSYAPVREVSWSLLLRCPCLFFLLVLVPRWPVEGALPTRAKGYPSPRVFGAEAVTSVTGERGTNFLFTCYLLWSPLGHRTHAAVTGYAPKFVVGDVNMDVLWRGFGMGWYYGYLSVVWCFVERS